jgi:arsenate reductase (thioredoxin)
MDQRRLASEPRTDRPENCNLPEPCALVRALGEPLRWRITELLATEQLCVTQLVDRLGVPQPLVSHHLQVLRRAGLVEAERERHRTYYQVRAGVLATLGLTMQILSGSAQDAVMHRHRALADGQRPASQARSLTVGRPPATTNPLHAAHRRVFSTSVIALQQEFSGCLPLESIEHFAHIVQDLHAEFRGVFSFETIQRYIDESIDLLAGAWMIDFVLLSVRAVVHERLRALAQAEGTIVNLVPNVLFICVHNTGRSQIAASLLNHYGAGAVQAYSAGTEPALQVADTAVRAMRELGIDLSTTRPKPLCDELVQAADVVVSMGCGEACPLLPGKRYLDWEVQDPEGKTLQEVRVIRDEIDGRVRGLLDQLRHQQMLARVSGGAVDGPRQAPV